ncbi:hypothetical protein Bbelb_095710 [Branchiostoma belcheri]|nr:hypothetical protein Bbelb_095710 [Branchiostoma belcheri]
MATYDHAGHLPAVTPCGAGRPVTRPAACPGPLRSLPGATRQGRDGGDHALPTWTQPCRNTRGKTPSVPYKGVTQPARLPARRHFENHVLFPAALPHNCAEHGTTFYSHPPPHQHRQNTDNSVQYDSVDILIAIEKSRNLPKLTESCEKLAGAAVLVSQMKKDPQKKVVQQLRKELVKQEPSGDVQKPSPTSPTPTTDYIPHVFTTETQSHVPHTHD